MSRCRPHAASDPTSAETRVRRRPPAETADLARALLRARDLNPFDLAL